MFFVSFPPPWRVRFGGSSRRLSLTRSGVFGFIVRVSIGKLSFGGVMNFLFYATLYSLGWADEEFIFFLLSVLNRDSNYIFMYCFEVCRTKSSH